MNHATLPRNFRKLTIEGRRKALADTYPFQDQEVESTAGPAGLLEMADLMVESAVGFTPIPLGIARGFLIDGEIRDIPMAVEEPSVIASASYAGTVLARAGGLITSGTEPVMTVQIFLMTPDKNGHQRILDAEDELLQTVNKNTASIVARGGGFRKLSCTLLPETHILKVEIDVDVRDAMGANLLNTLGEQLRPRMEELSGGSCLMSIISNSSRERRAQARFSLPIEQIPLRDQRKFTRKQLAERITAASLVAREDSDRAVTHNKGIMNGIHALALATGNDTRALEAAVHAWASRDGRYRGLSTYYLEDDKLVGSLELPVPLATVGGAVSSSPASRFSLRILKDPDSVQLGRIAAALGLAQNFAALLALVSEGIQKGHMKLHAARLAYQAGARGNEARAVAEILAREGTISSNEAKKALAILRSE